MDDAEKYALRQEIAASLDHPSVFMGGPSHGSVKKAIDIIRLIEQSLDVSPKERLSVTADQVRTWRKSSWDSFERI